MSPELKIHIEYMPLNGKSRLYVWDERSFYQVQDGKIIATIIDQTSPNQNDKFFVEAPEYFIQGIANALMDKHNLKEDLKNSGRNERFKDETNWLRSLIEKQLK